MQLRQQRRCSQDAWFHGLLVWQDEKNLVKTQFDQALAAQIGFDRPPSPEAAVEVAEFRRVDATRIGYQSAAMLDRKKKD